MTTTNAENLDSVSDDYDSKENFVSSGTPRTVADGRLSGACTRRMWEGTGVGYTAKRRARGRAALQCDGFDDGIIVGLDLEWEQDPRSPLRNRVIAYGLSVLRGDKSSETVVLTNG